VATPKAWDREIGQSIAERTRFVDDQRAAILRALDEYNPGVPPVFGLNFGHADPQIVIPYSGSMTVDEIHGTVTVTY
jgi:muramoyltetrapeptide carboxypeptidase LdcA involved in peptidoglycan recycling